MTSLSFSVLHVCMAFLPFAFSIPINPGLDASKIQLNYLGTVEGKSYFTEQNVQLDWLEAKAFCNASGMRLASISTKAQLEMLKNAYNSDTFYTYVWTGGRASPTPSLFLWDHNNEVLNSTVHSGMPFNEIEFCVDYHPQPNENYVHGLLCSTLRAVLCEVTTGK